MRTKGLIAVVGSIACLTLFFFQNCSSTNFTPVDQSTTQASSTPNHSYAWVTNNYGACSVSCGGGTQTRPVFCQREDGAEVDDNFCTGTKPTSTQSCNMVACEVDHWVESGFSACSAPCGGGTEMQTISCQDQNNAVVDSSRCTSPAPATSQACNTQACVTYSWVKSGFGSCSAACGGGTQSQTVTCQDSNGNTVADSFCSATPKPPVEQACNAQVCMTYNWAASGFGTCSATCGGGSQSQTVVCKDSNGNAVADSFCNAASKPAVAQSCNTQACLPACNAFDPNPPIFQGDVCGPGPNNCNNYTCAGGEQACIPTGQACGSYHCNIYCSSLEMNWTDTGTGGG